MNNNKALQDFLFVSKYARTNGTKKETFEEAVDRIMGMHRKFIKGRYNVNSLKLEEYLGEVRQAYIDKHILGAQRALQWGGDQLLSKHTRMYNCAASYVDRVDFFRQLMFLLLSGAGVGYSVQKAHVNKLPTIEGVQPCISEEYVAEDSIEGWSECIKVLFEAYFYGHCKPQFNLSNIRPKGSFISGGFKAPGPEPLRKALELCEKILKGATNRKLTTVEASDLSCIIADAVISGGVRRAALLGLFSADDEEFMKYKTGNWFYEHNYRARVNVSAAVLPTTPYEVYENIFKNVKEYGEPGILFLKDINFVYNPSMAAS